MRRERVEISPISELSTQYYLTLDVKDQPGVLASVARVFGEHHVSIRSMEQIGLGGVRAWCSLPTQPSRPMFRPRCLRLAELDVVARVGVLLRVIGPER